ncbi:hypothetical protein [Arthrobacter methylotrophus]|uniref:Uncharacterized protein n=1 Tax=Arthrobacter methylotrophus TaxID=121291 RepID=A0ABV5UTQ0_9MICC
MYNITKGLPPNFGNQQVDALVSIFVALASGLVTLMLFNVLLGFPKVELTWVIGREPPANSRPELTHRETGVCFRYLVTADTYLARWILSLTARHLVEAQLQFSPMENLRIRKQVYGRETALSGGCLTTRFKNGLSKGPGADGEISLHLKEPRSISTKIDCELSVHPLVKDKRSWRALLLSKCFKTDATIEGFAMKGDSIGSVDKRDDIRQANPGSL